MAGVYATFRKQLEIKSKQMKIVQKNNIFHATNIFYEDPSIEIKLREFVNIID